MTQHQVADRDARDEAALAYIRAKQALGDSTTGRVMTDALLEVDWTWHELLVAYGERCGCAEGTCPSSPPAEIVVELPEGDTDDYWRSDG